MHSSRIVRAATLVVIFAAVGCAGSSKPPEPRHVPFAEAALRPYLASGTSTLTGQAFYKQAGGGVVYAAGETVELIPWTPHTEEWWTREFLGGQTLQADSDEAQAKMRLATRGTIADGSGNFEFRNIPGGRYLVVTQKTWDVPTVGRQGGRFGMPVEVAGGAQMRIVVSP